MGGKDKVFGVVFQRGSQLCMCATFSAALYSQIESQSPLNRASHLIESKGLDCAA